MVDKCCLPNLATAPSLCHEHGDYDRGLGVGVKPEKDGIDWRFQVVYSALIFT